MQSTNFLYYPEEPEEYQRLFVKMEIFSRRNNNRVADDIIYLPLPLGMLREESGATWSWSEFGVAGEAGRAVAEYMANNGEFKTLRTNMERMNQSFSNLNRGFNTFLERQLQETELEAFQALRQGAGYAKRPNITFIFENINNLRDFRFEWTLRPKNLKDARKIEKIVSVIQKASLPAISDMSAYREIYNFFTGEVYRNDQIGKSDVEVGEDFTHKLFSSTFIAPKEFELSVHERVMSPKGHMMMEPVSHLVNFPLPFVCQDFTFQMGGEDSEADTFIKENNEYFTASYYLNLGYLELSHFTADEVGEYRTFKGN